ncbi:antitoxin Xre/MbcA/ParS toxin-binding domain-containing protein [Xanthomonas bundabergensis]|uniref:antitoxin Xre/MbcA/ParS toxin-binding domain-containing protein n=1 Tax=Xanthomonas bundabergensis TaxID=3160842 RepID=UPI00351741FD
MPHPASNEQRIKAVLQGMRRGERNKASRLARSTDLLALIDSASYGSTEDAQRVIDWLARDADTLAPLREAHLRDVGEMICIVWNGCGGDREALSQWLNGNHPQLGGHTPRQLLQEGASARLLDAARACFAG